MVSTILLIAGGTAIGSIVLCGFFVLDLLSWHRYLEKVARNEQNQMRRETRVV